MSLDPALQADLGEALEQAVLEVGAPGATAAVCLGERGRWLGASGEVDFETGEALAVDDVFRIGSITKTYVSALILQQVEDGTLALDEPLATWLPDLLDRGDEITLRMLLSHTSGLPSYTDIGEFLLRMDEEVSPEEVIARCDEEPDRFEPGTGWDYSNTNYFVLALLLEEVTGEDWHAFQRRELLDPLGLDRTWVEGHEADRAALVSGHVSQVVVGDDQYDPSWGWASGGMVSTALDQARWLAALLGGEVVSEGSLAEMTTPVVLPDGTEIGYGLGFFVQEGPGGLAIGHTGSTMGFQSDLFQDAATGVVVAALVNDFTAEASDVALGLWEVALAE